MKNRTALSGVFLLILGIATGLIGVSIDGARAQSALHEVTIDNLAFTPASITVNIGDSVRWTNSDNEVHTVTSNNATWDSGNIPIGSNYTYTFSIAGTHTYRCTIHPAMTGSVTVVAPTLTPTQVSTPTLTATPTRTNTPVVVNTITDLPPTSTFTVNPTQTATATQTPSHTPTPTVRIQDTATPTNTPLPPTVTMTPSPTSPGAPATATATRSAPLPPNTGSGSDGPGRLPFLATAIILVLSGLGLAAVSMRPAT